MKKGFTVVELLAVIVVVAVLTLVAIPELVKVINTSKESSKLETDQIIAEQFDKASLKNGCYIVEDGIINRKGNYSNPDDAKIIPDAKGDLPEEGWVIMKDDSVIKGQFIISDTIINYDGKDAHLDKEKEGYSLDDSCSKD